jgi:signal peptidase II
LKKIFKEYWLLLTVALVVIGLDQFTKEIVRANLPFGTSWMPLEWLAPYFRFVHWQNTGAAFGLFQQGGLVFSILAILVSIFIIYYFPQIPRNEKMMRAALALQLGGAIGNLIDRLRFGPVTDFLSFGNFPVFNVADASISIGVAVLILGLWISERKMKEQALMAEDQTDTDSSQSGDQPMESRGDL